MQINQNMRDIRALKGIKQQAMAKALGISQNSYSRLERGLIIMTDEKKKKAAAALQVSEDVLEFSTKNLYLSVRGSKAALWRILEPSTHCRKNR